MAELWKDVAGYEGLYQISNKGRVKSLPHIVRRKSKWDEKKHTEFMSKERFLSPCIVRGYERVVLFKEGTGTKFLVHRLVAAAFIENENPKYTIINHKDGNKLNNTVENLEWCDYNLNMQHAYDTGLQKLHEEHHQSKLKNEEVAEIRRLRQTEHLTSGQLAEMFNVSKSSIKNILNYKTWKGI